MRRIYGVWLVLLLSVLIGCEFLPDVQLDQEEEYGNGKFVITRIVEDTSIRSISSKGLSTRKVGDTFELWVMPTKRGFNEPIMHENVRYIKKFKITKTGKYEIPLSAFHPDEPSVVFIIRLSEGVDPEVVGFLSLRINDSFSVIEFPPGSEMGGDIAFGTVYFSDDSYIATSELDLEYNRGSFSKGTLQSLQEPTLSKNIALMSLNILWNTHKDVFYAPGLNFFYNSGEEDSSFVNVWVYSDDYLSEALLLLPDDMKDYPSEVYRKGTGPRSSVQWSQMVPLSKYIQSAKKRSMWPLKDVEGNRLAEFDMSIALIFDKNNKPIFPCIAPTYTVKHDDPSVVESIRFNWFYYDFDGSTKIPITDKAEITSLVRENSFYMDLYFGEDQPDRDGVTYQFRPEPRGRSFAMRGSLVEATDFDSPLKVEDLAYLSFGYRFSFYDCHTDFKPVF